MITILFFVVLCKRISRDYISHKLREYYLWSNLIIYFFRIMRLGWNLDYVQMISHEITHQTIYHHDGSRFVYPQFPYHRLRYWQVSKFVMIFILAGNLSVKLFIWWQKYCSQSIYHHLVYPRRDMDFVFIQFFTSQIFSQD